MVHVVVEVDHPPDERITAPQIRGMILEVRPVVAPAQPAGEDVPETVQECLHVVFVLARRTGRVRHAHTVEHPPGARSPHGWLGERIFFPPHPLFVLIKKYFVNS